MDVRSAAEFHGERFWPSGGMEPGAQAGHIPSAVHRPLGDLYNDDGSFRSALRLRDAFAPDVLDGDDELITYCTIGGRAATAWFVLSYLLGRERVRVYDGSWAEWGRLPGADVERPLPAIGVRDGDRDKEPALLQGAQDQPDGAVDFSGLRCVKTAREVSKAGGVDGSHLVDQHKGPGAIHLDLGTEDGRLCAGGRRGDDKGGEHDPIALNSDRVPRPALLMAHGVLSGAQPVQVTTH